MESEERLLCRLLFRADMATQRLRERVGERERERESERERGASVLKRVSNSSSFSV